MKPPNNRCEWSICPEHENIILCRNNFATEPCEAVVVPDLRGLGLSSNKADFPYDAVGAQTLLVLILATLVYDARAFMAERIII